MATLSFGIYMPTRMSTCPRVSKCVIYGCSLHVEYDSQVSRRHVSWESHLQHIYKLTVAYPRATATATVTERRHSIQNDTLYH